MALCLATLFSMRQHARMPLLILGVGIAEPPLARRAGHHRRIIARLIVRRHALTQALQARSLCFFFFHRHTSFGNSTRDCLKWELLPSCELDVNILCAERDSAGRRIRGVAIPAQENNTGRQRARRARRHSDSCATHLPGRPKSHPCDSRHNIASIGRSYRLSQICGRRQSNLPSPQRNQSCVGAAQTQDSDPGIPLCYCLPLAAAFRRSRSGEWIRDPLPEMTAVHLGSRKGERHMEYLVQMKLATYGRSAAQIQVCIIWDLTALDCAALQDLLGFSFPQCHNSKFT